MFRREQEEMVWGAEAFVLPIANPGWEQKLTEAAWGAPIEFDWIAFGIIILLIAAAVTAVLSGDTTPVTFFR